MKRNELLSDNPVSRRSDPLTSHLAESEITDSGKRGTQQKTLLEAVFTHPGKTSAELARACEVDRYVAARRLPELRSAGLVLNGEARKCSVTGRKAITWQPDCGQMALL